MRRMALRAHHAEPAEPNPQRPFNAFPRARALPAQTFRPEINGPAATGSPAWRGGVMLRPAPRESATRLSEQWCTVGARSKRLTSS